MSSLRPIVGLSVFGVLAACSAEPRVGEQVGETSEEIKVVCGAPANGPVQGVDVSYYQGDFDWKAQKAQGVAFGYARVSDGVGFDDPQFKNNWTKMKAAGILRGAYQFFEPAQDATAQANKMVAAIGKLGDGDLPAMIDVEATGGQSPATIAAKVKVWLDIVEKGTGRPPFIYSGSYFWEGNVQSTAFGATPFWIAAYGPKCPSLPNGWSNWLIWQYSDGNGTLDHDVFNGTLAQLQAYARAPDVAPRGYLDVADCAGIGGWAQDPDAPTAAVSVDLYFDGPAGVSKRAQRTTADVPRQDLCKAIGSCEHGFRIAPPAALFDGKPHTVHAYGIDTSPGGSTALLADAPKTFSCARPRLPSGVVRRHVVDPTSLAAWHFDAFRDVFVHPQADVDALPKGVDLPAAPRLVQAAGDPRVFVLDGALKRHVLSPASLAAWRFDVANISQVPRSVVDSAPTGADWPDAPLVVQGDAAPEIDVLDVVTGGEVGPSSPENPGSLPPVGATDETDAPGSDAGCSASGGPVGGLGWIGSALAIVVGRRRRR